MASDDKKKALDAAIAKLEKDFGKGTVMKLGDPAARVAVETVPTGSEPGYCIRTWRGTKRTSDRDIWPRVKW